MGFPGALDLVKTLYAPTPAPTIAKPVANLTNFEEP